MSAMDLDDAQAVEITDDADSMAALEVAEAAREAGDLEEALAIYDGLLKRRPDHVEGLFGRGVMLRLRGRPQEALIALRAALAADPDHRAARLEMAVTLHHLGRSDEARTIYAVMVREPDSPSEAWHGLGMMLLAEGREAAAETALRRAVALTPDRIEARLQLADMLARRMDLAGAVDLYHDIVTLDPDSSAAHAGLGQALIGLGRLDEAEDQLERALALNGTNALAHVNRARLNLLDGNLPGAWDDLEWRWQMAGRSRPSPPGRAWNGDDELTGQTILLWAEQGIADTLSLLRYVPMVAERGAKVVLGLPAALAPLAHGIAGVAMVAVSGQKLPAGTIIDYNAPLPDLPRLFGTRLASIPGDAYVRAPAGHRVRIAAPPGAMLKIGLAWSGPHGAGSIPLPQLMPLFGLPGTAFFALQVGDRMKDANMLAHPALITDLAPTTSNYADLAGRIAEMDLVISVDNAVAHLAGAMGRPLWALLGAAADWRWMRGRDDTPWYPSARLFRQDRPDDWTGLITRVMMALEDHVADEAERRLAAARELIGPQAMMRALLATHLQAGDLLVDIGAAEGGHALDAAAHPAGDIMVLAVEAQRAEAEVLADTIAIAGADEQVEVVAAPMGAAPAPAVVAKVAKRGRRVFPLPEWVRAPMRTTTLPELLAERPRFDGRRILVRLGATGSEAAVLDGMEPLLAEHRVALVVFDHREEIGAAERLLAAGYRLFRFPAEVAAGTLHPFTGEIGPVLALAPASEPAAVYGDASDPTSPAAVARAEAEAGKLAAQASTALRDGKVNAAGKLLTRALAQDPNNAEANANLGGLLRRIGRADAAAACWRRALANGAGPAVRANLANVLREIGQLAAAETAFTEAVTAEPENARFLYGFGLLRREQGRAKESLALFERADHLAPGTVPRREMATALLKSGNLARGIAEMIHRTAPRIAPVAAPVWDGSRLEARTILVRDENDAIDTIMLSRFIPQVARQGGLVTVECVPEAARLMATIPGVEQVVPRGQPLPECDVTVNLLDVPRLIGTTSRTTPPRDVPYLHLPDGAIPFRFPADGQLKVGIAWAGRERDRIVPLPVLLRLAADPDVGLVSLQRGTRADDLPLAGGRLLVEDMGPRCKDFADTAAIISGLDLVIAADTVEAHLAAAMGKPVWVMLPLGNDWRWVDSRDDSVWYPTMRVFRQALDGSWDRALARVTDSLTAMAAAKRKRR
jgi:tetratricopeptide (TPR) repeat protein